MDRIRVLIAEDNPDTCENLRCLLSFEGRVEILGTVPAGEEALKKAEKLRPHILLLGLGNPPRQGLELVETVTCRVPEVAVVIMSADGSRESLRQAMAAGAREYMVRPFSSDELTAVIHRVYEREMRHRLQRKNLGSQRGEAAPGQVVTIFSTKGGVGKTTLAVNLGVSLVEDYGFSVVLLDLDLQFGDAAVMLNLMPRLTCSDLAAEQSQLDGELLDSYLVKHSSGLKLLAAPARPEYAELVSPSLVEKIIKLLKDRYDFLLIDTPGNFTDTGMVALDYASLILFLTSLDLPTLKNTKLGLEVLDSLHHKDKVRAVLNRATPEIGIGLSDVEKTLGLTLTAQIPSDGRLVVNSINKGKPFVLSNPQSRVAESVRHLAYLLAQRDEDDHTPKQTRRSRFRLFGK